MISMTITAPDSVAFSHEIYKLYALMADANMAPPMETTQVALPPPGGNEASEEQTRVADVGSAAPPPSPRTRRKKAEMEAARAGDTSPPDVKETLQAFLGLEETTAAVITEATAEVADETPALTFEDVKAALRAVVVAKGFDISVSALSDMGVDSLKKISADRYGEAVEHFNKIAA